MHCRYMLVMALLLRQMASLLRCQSTVLSRRLWLGHLLSLQSPTTSSNHHEPSFQRKYSAQTPPVKMAKILSLSDPNDSANHPLHNTENLPTGVVLLQVGRAFADFDLPMLQREGVNTIFVSAPQSRESLAQLLQALPSVEWVHTRSAGIDFVTSPTLEAFVGTVTNAKGQFSSTLAEYTLMACSYFAKDLPRLIRNKQSKEWDAYNVLELRGARLGIVGFGDIGRACAKLAAVFGMHVTALRRNPQPDPLCDEVYGSSRENLNRLFAECDYILCSAPLTSETKGLIGKEQFDVAKQDAVFINLGRGPVVDENALISALQSKKLKGAALDVFEIEPLPKTSLLWELENVLLSPHNMDRTATFMTESTDFFLREQIPRFIRGEELLNKVNAKTGY